MSGQVRLSRSYVLVAVVFAAQIVVSAAIGVALGTKLPRPVRQAVVFNTSMRDFAVASGIAAAAFAPAAAGPLGLYGIMVMVMGWGAVLARITRR